MTPRTAGAGRAQVSAALVAIVVAMLALAGCGFGAGEAAEGTATLTVTRDYGAERLLEATGDDLTESETVVRFLDREAEVETSYGGNFVDAIDGVRSASTRAGRSDWFFYVNGYLSPIGAGEARVRPGDRIWWDYHPWEGAPRVPAVVGSWPEPFVHGFDGRVYPVRIDCFGSQRACNGVASALSAEGVGAEIVPGGRDAGDDVLRVLVGQWDAVRADEAAALLERDPTESGVFARFARDGRGWSLVALDAAAEPAATFARGAGLIAAVRLDPQQPAWVVTGTDDEGVGAAASLLGERLRDAYALAATPGKDFLRLPMKPGEG